MATLRTVTDASHFESSLSSVPSESLAVLYFHTTWAAPCAQMSTVLSTLASTYPAEASSSPAFLSINAEDLPDVAEEYDVTAVPFVVLLRGGKTLDTVSGGDAAKVRATVEKHAGANASSSRTQLPPAQQVTPRPQEKGTHSSGAADEGASNLSAYAPSAKDPETAPQYSSSTTPALGSGSTNAGAGGDDLQTRLTELVKAAPCMLFMKGTPSAPQCGFSRQLVSILREHGVRYGFFNILADEEIRQGLKAFADWPTFPQLWMGGELVGGLDIVKEECEADPEFFAEYAVEGKGRNRGGPAAPEMQAKPVEA